MKHRSASNTPNTLLSLLPAMEHPNTRVTPPSPSMASEPGFDAPESSGLYNNGSMPIAKAIMRSDAYSEHPVSLDTPSGFNAGGSRIRDVSAIPANDIVAQCVLFLEANVFYTDDCPCQHCLEDIEEERRSLEARLERAHRAQIARAQGDRESQIRAAQQNPLPDHPIDIAMEVFTRSIRQPTHPKPPTLPAQAGNAAWMLPNTTFQPPPLFKLSDRGIPQSYHSPIMQGPPEHHLPFFGPPAPYLYYFQGGYQGHLIGNTVAPPPHQTTAAHQPHLQRPPSAMAPAMPPPQRLDTPTSSTPSGPHHNLRSLNPVKHSGISQLNGGEEGSSRGYKRQIEEEDNDLPLARDRRRRSVAPSSTPPPTRTPAAAPSAPAGVDRELDYRNTGVSIMGALSHYGATRDRAVALRTHEERLVFGQVEGTR